MPRRPAISAGWLVYRRYGPVSLVVMPGLVPGIHVFAELGARRGWPGGQARHDGKELPRNTRRTLRRAGQPEGFRIDEALDRVPDEPRDRVVVAVMGEAGDEGDRA